MPAAPKITGAVRSKNPLKGAVEILSERLYYAALKSPPPSHNILASTPRGRKKSESQPSEKKQIHFFNIDQELVYWNFFLDFGPLNLGQLFRFCAKLNDKLRRFPVVCFYSNSVPTKRANAIFLICAWQVMYLQRTPDQAYKGFDLDASTGELEQLTLKKGFSQRPVSTSQGLVTIEELPPFHDASPCACTYDLSVRDCLDGLYKVMRLGLFDMNSFDVEEYEHFEQVENGDLNWLLPGKILAFAGPSFQRHVSPEGYCTLAPSDYIPYFLKKRVGLVVRLNKRAYNEQDFVKAGINHVEAFFVDGSCPPMKILRGVMDAFESVPPGQAFAVHCKAGLGRTGTCVGAYMMKHYRFTAAECIAWMRMSRPGSVIGPQQHFLEKLQPLMWQEGEAAGIIARPISSSNSNKRGSMGSQNSGMDTDEAETGRAGQADALLNARISRRAKSSRDPPAVGPPTPSRTTPEPTSGITAVPITPDSAASRETTLWCN